MPEKSLAIKCEGYPCAVSMPEGAPSVNYPDFTYRGEESLDLPKEGTMTIRYRVTEESESTRNGDETYRCTVEVLSIKSVKGDKKEAEDDAPTKRYDDAAGALDELRKKRESE